MKIHSFVPLGLGVLLALPLAAHADPLSVFQPTQIKAISVTPTDARARQALPPLEAFGAVRGTRSPAVDEVGTAGEAAQDAGFALRLPGNVPAALANQVHYQVTQRAKTTFTFDKVKAAAWARQHKVALTALPAGLDGATYTATLEPIAIVTYGTQPHKREHGVRRGTFLAVMQAPDAVLAFVRLRPVGDDRDRFQRRGVGRAVQAGRERGERDLVLARPRGGLHLVEREGGLRALRHLIVHLIRKRGGDVARQAQREARVLRGLAGGADLVDRRAARAADGPERLERRKRLERARVGRRDRDRLDLRRLKNGERVGMGGEGQRQQHAESERDERMDLHRVNFVSQRLGNHKAGARLTHSDRRTPAGTAGRPRPRS